jgi:predicted tellurium resistance membrane protein TerC
VDLLAPFASAAGWVSLLTLIFLEMVLGIDNLVFIAITTDRLPEKKKHIGRRFGLIAALVMRIILLSLGFLIIHLKVTIFTLPFAIPGTDPAFDAKDLILLLGGGYLVYKGIVELRAKISYEEIADDHHEEQTGQRKSGLIGLPQAIGTIALMDMIFSLDSVITAIGLAGDALLVMILAVMIAVLVMIVFADPISEFINNNPEMKILALTFIVIVGVKLVAEAFGIEILVEGTHVEVMDLMLYFAMFFSIAITAIQMVYNNRVKLVAKEHAEQLEKTDEG